MKPYRLVGSILSVKGDCTAGHKVGEQNDLTIWDQEKDTARRASPLCAFFYDMIFPYRLFYNSEESFPGKKARTRFKYLVQTQLIK